MTKGNIPGPNVRSSVEVKKQHSCLRPWWRHCARSQQQVGQKPKVRLAVSPSWVSGGAAPRAPTWPGAAGSERSDQAGRNPESSPLRPLLLSVNPCQAPCYQQGCKDDTGARCPQPQARGTDRRNAGAPLDTAVPGASVNAAWQRWVSAAPGRPPPRPPPALPRRRQTDGRCDHGQPAGETGEPDACFVL